MNCLVAVLRQVGWTILLAFVIISSGCASPRKIVTLDKIPVRSDMNPVALTIKFDDPPRLVLPNGEPESVEDYIRTGMFWAKRDNYGEAAIAMERAAGIINSPANELYRTCLLSASVCHLLTGDKSGFARIFDRFKRTYNRYEWINMSESRREVRELMLLRDGFIRQRKNNDLRVAR